VHRARWLTPKAVSVAPKFDPNDRFRGELRRRIEPYFTSTGRRPRDSRQLYLKAAVVLGGFVTSYALLVSGAATWRLALARPDAARDSGTSGVSTSAADSACA